MTLVTRSGILLRSHPYSESSRILRFLTAESGIVALVARGARRQSSRGGAPLDHFDQVEIVYDHRPGRDLHTLREFRTLARRSGLGRDLVRFTGASFLAELVLAHTMEEPDPELHAELSGGLDRLASESPEDVPGTFLAVGWAILRRFGFPPALDACVRCGALMSDAEELVRFDVASGGLLCPGCGSGASGPRLGPGARRDLSLLVHGTPPRPLRGAREHFALLDRFALHHLERTRPFRSTSILAPLLPAHGDDA